MKHKLLFLSMLALVISTPIIPSIASALELTEGLSVSGKWYVLSLGQIFYGPSSTLTVKEVSGNKARVVFSWTDWTEDPNNIVHAGSAEIVASVTVTERNVKKISFGSSKRRGKITFTFDPSEPVVKGEKRFQGKIIDIELK